MLHESFLLHKAPGTLDYPLLPYLFLTHLFMAFMDVYNTSHLCSATRSLPVIEEDLAHVARFSPVSPPVIYVVDDDDNNDHDEDLPPLDDWYLGIALRTMGQVTSVYIK